MSGSAPRDTASWFRQYGPVVYRRARRLLGTHEDAEEATQEIFVRVLKSRDSFEGKSSVTTWLYQITTNYCLNQIRDRRRHRELLDAHGAAQEIHGGPPAAADHLTEARRLLASADQDQAEAAIYVFVDGMSHEEAAELLGVSRRTVGNLLERFRAWAENQGETLPKRGPLGVEEGKRS